MTKLKNCLGISLAASFLLLGLCSRVLGDEPLNFKEVYDLIRANLTGLNEAELDRAAALGLIEQLQPKVMLITNEAGTKAESNSPAILRSAVYDKSYAYIRMGELKAGADKELIAAYQALASSNRLKGLVIDLRFASGQDYDAAAAVVNWFFPTEQPLIDYGQGIKKSTAKTNAYTRPLAILVNRKTAGGAEAVAGILRQADIGLSLGSPTAGLAAIGKEFTLKTGQRLRLATTPIKIGKGETMSLSGLKPDIAVDVSLEDEAVYVEDPYKNLSKGSLLARAGMAGTSTNRLRPRINEAELVRMLRDGENLEMDSNATARGSEPLRPVMQDPVLARGLDLLKGLSVLRQFRTL